MALLLGTGIEKMTDKKIEQKQEEKLVTVSIWSKIKHWWRTLIREEWELTVFFPGEVKFLEDGSRIESGAPKTYRAKEIKRLLQHISFLLICLE